jgi:hypothetical protein
MRYFIRFKQISKQRYLPDATPKNEYEETFACLITAACLVLFARRRIQETAGKNTVSWMRHKVP